MTKDLGSVSRYLVPEGRAYETVVFQAGKPVLDRELNLSQDLDGGAAQAALRSCMPSGWLSDDFLTTSSATSALFKATNVANAIVIPRLRAHVRGWLITVECTNFPDPVEGANQLDLGVAPAAGQPPAAHCTLVILEVWRRLISAVPESAGKSASGRIWRNGNVKIAAADDAALNYDDDLMDAGIAEETTKRVQLQYRLRVIQNVDVFGYPYGIDAPSVVAHTVPEAANEPDGNPVTGAFYVNQADDGDAGLWRAGDPVTNELGTVDGYMYAVPLLTVFRRNTAPFSNSNLNGGVTAPGPSDRPDGLFNDIIAASDLLDQRHGVTPDGWDLQELLDKNTNAILDNSLRTEITTIGGCQGTTVLMANTFGNVAPPPEQQQFDSVRRRFSDRAIYETCVVKLAPQSGSWLDSASANVVINRNALPVHPWPAFNWEVLAPDGVMFLDVVEIYWAGSVGFLNAEPFIRNVAGLGTQPITNVVVQLDSPALAGSGLTNETLYVTLLVGYPRGVGLTKTPAASFGLSSFAPLSTNRPPSWVSFGPNALDAPHREVLFQYQAEAQPSIQYTQGAGATPTNTVRLAERASSILGVDTVPPQPAGGFTLSDSGRVVTLSVLPTAGSTITVKYTATRPMPHYSSSTPMLVYFQVAAPQMARSQIAGTSLALIPRLVCGKMLSLTAGSGSQDESYPFPFQHVQTGGVFPEQIGDYAGESDLAGTAEISVADFNASTGMLGLPTYVSMVANPEAFTIERKPEDIDVEGRSFFKSVPAGAGYFPNAYAQDLSNPDRHKNVLPILAELAENGPLGHRGQLVMVLLIRYAMFDETNAVFFDSDPTTTTASVFRVKGLLLSKRGS